MKVSIIVTVYNSENTIERTIQSIKEQSYKNIEIVFIDNNSTDKSLEIINKYIEDSDILISEPDNGLYDALNKGIKNSSGDIISMLHSDDFYPNDNVIFEYITIFEKKNISIAYGNVDFISKKNKIVRKYKSGNLSINQLAWGRMPAHSTMFIKRRIYETYGLYKNDFKICGDYEFMCRIVKQGNFNFYYLDKVTCLMQIGGLSTQGISSTIIINKEIYKSLKINNIYSNYLMIYSKYIFKILEFVFYNKKNVNKE